MATQKTSCCSNKLRYDLTFKVLSIDFSDGDNKANLSVIVRLPEKSVTINAGDGIEEKKKESQETSKSRASSKNENREPKDRKAVTIEDEDDDTESQQKRPLASRRPTKYNFNKLTCDSSDESDSSLVPTSRCDTAASETFSSIDGDDEASASSLKPPNVSRSTRKSVKTASNRDSFFGAATERLKCTPLCLAQALTKHCIKYDVLCECQLMGSLSSLNLNKLLTKKTFLLPQLRRLNCWPNASRTKFVTKISSPTTST